jgi:hypothetical protein
MIKRINILFLILLLISGCTLEQKLARNYVSKEKPGQFLLLEPDFIFKYNLKEFEIEDIDTYDEKTKDSLLLKNSLFVKDVIDSIFLWDFLSHFTHEFEKYGAEVLSEKAVDTLLENGGSPYVLNIAQFSLEEFIHPYNREEIVYDELLVIDGFDVNALNFNVWIELGKMNTENKNKVLFASKTLYDEVDGILKQNLFTGDITFDYTIDTITINQIYSAAADFGRITSGYLYDYLMNAYIDQNLPDNYQYERTYYHYDSKRNLLFTAEEMERLIELDNY